uniref:Putative secreted protein n=1 Tax=Rhipicephalus microplus TaxID=6941 RepID=A0A6M2CSV2_RHIMP
MALSPAWECWVVLGFLKPLFLQLYLARCGPISLCRKTKWSKCAAVPLHALGCLSFINSNLMTNFPTLLSFIQNDCQNSTINKATSAFKVLREHERARRLFAY